MYRDRAVRDGGSGRVVGGTFASPISAAGPVARVAPNRKWFGNTRVVSQNDLERFRTAMAQSESDPFSVVLRRKQLPMGLLTEPKAGKVDVLRAESFEDITRGRRKKPRLPTSDLTAMVKAATERSDLYDEARDGNIYKVTAPSKARRGVNLALEAGQSRRIKRELFKVIDASDVILQVIDARDPMGTRCRAVEDYMTRPENRHKHLVAILNKCDLVPTWVTSRWVSILMKEMPTLAFHASLTHAFGKGALIQLLRQFALLHKEKRQISVGFIGYPNVGKSSIINTLRSKAVVKVAPIPGETKVWQYVTLMRRIYLIDCPGVVYPAEGDTESELVLKGVVRVENLKEPADHIPLLLERAKREYIVKIFGINEWTDAQDFLEQLAQKRGRLLKGNEPDTHTTARQLLQSWQIGKIPYFVAPPPLPDREPASEAKEEEPHVEQQFGHINVRHDFEEEGAGVEADQEDGGVDWDDVYATVAGDVVDEIPSAKRSATDDIDTLRAVDSEEEEPQVREKGKRKTTNKGKIGVHFYSSANVKNRRLRQK